MAAAAPGFYRFEAKIISRGGGRSLIASAAYRTGGKSATSAAAYRAGEQLTDERTGETYDYTKKRGIKGAEIMLPSGAPAWMNDRAKLWNAVEAAEKRKDAQTARDYLLSIPHQLSPEQRRALVKWFVAEQFVTKGYAADIAFHGPDAREGLNHHAHVMVTMRRVEGEGFARTKERPPAGTHPMKAWKDDLLKLREAWAVSANRFLEAAGLDIRITHESLQTRGIDREPDPKLGPVAGQIEAQGRESHAGNDRREVAARNAEREQLKLEHAQAVADEARIIDLMQQRIRSGAMDDHGIEATARAMPELMREAAEDIRTAEAKAQAILRREAELTQQRIDAFRAQAKSEEERAARDREMQIRADEIRQRDGAIRSAEARYAIALGETAHPDALTNLVRAAGAESAAFLRQQEAMRAQLADPKLTEAQKQDIHLRKQIEFYDYNALTNDRLSGMYRVVGGEAHTQQAEYRAQLAEASRDRAQALRDERGQHLEAERQREAARDERVNPSATRPAANDPAPAPRSRLTEEQLAKLRQLDAADRAQEKFEAEKRAKQQARDHDRPSGDRIDTSGRAPGPGSRSTTPDEQRAREAESTRRGQAAGRTDGKDTTAAEMTDAKQAKLAKLDALDRAYNDHAAKAKDRDRGGGRER